MRPIPVVLGLTLVLTACGDPTDLSRAGLEITPSDSGLWLTNESGVQLFYQAADVEVLGLWAGPAAVMACRDPECPHLAPGARALVPWADALWWNEETRRVAVTWWRVVPAGKGRWRRAGTRVETREVDLP